MEHKTFKATALSTGIAIALGTAPPVLAQEDEGIEEITVTGSHIRRTEYEGRAPIQIVDAQAIELTGAAQPVELLNELTVNSGSQFYGETNSGAGVSQFNIRNLGRGSSLTLINGKRAGIAPVADATGADFVDINQFPLAMIERVEVLTNGASATYGSQAVAGVANIITRKGMEGIEVSGGFSAAEIDAWNVNLAAGSQFDNGGFNIYMTHYEQGQIGRTELDWLDSRLGGNGIQARSRFLSGTGSPGSVERAMLGANGEATSVSIPDPLNPGETLGAIRYPDEDCVAAGGVIGDLVDTGLNPNTCRYDFADQVGVISEEKRNQMFAEFDWEFSDTLTYNVEASFSNNEVQRQNGGQLLATGKATGGGTTILPSHPFNFYVEDPADPLNVIYVDPATWDPTVHCTDITSAATCQFQTATLRSIHRPLGATHTGTDLSENTRRELNYTRIMNQLEFTLPNDWYLDVSHMWAKSTSSSVGPSAIRSDTYQQLLRDGAWNPFGTRVVNPTLVSPKDVADTANCFNDVLGACTAGNSQTVQDQWNQNSVSKTIVDQQVVDVVVAGELFEIGDNMVSAAFGGQFRSVSSRIFPDSLSSAGEDGGQGISGEVSGRQNVTAIFAEAVMPLGDLGEVQVAVRNEDYGDGVDTTDPKVGFEFGLTDSIGFRGSWGTSFQAPTIRQTGRASSSAFIDDPASATGPGGSFVCTNTQVANNISVIVEGAPGLSPQEADNINLGLVYQNDSFRASLDYFLFDYTDLIGAEAGVQAIVDGQCAGIEDTGLPIIADSRVTRDATGQVRQVRSRFVNIGSVETSGLDFNTDYTMDFRSGTLIFDLNATYLLAFDVDTDGDGVQEFDGAGNRNTTNGFNTLPEVRGNFSTTWYDGNHTARLSFNHIGGYENDQSNNADINSWNVWDIMYSYTFSGLIGDGDTTLSVGANNIFDEDPPATYRADAAGVRQGRFLSNGRYNRGWVDRPGYDDRAGHDIRGQIVYFRFKHLF